MGGLGLIGVEAKYDALSHSFMLWLLAEEEHPLRLILRSHIAQISEKRWGTADTAWIVSNCGTMQLTGSAPWKNLCKGWTHLKSKLAPRRPVNLEEWGALPLWRPHVNHVNRAIVKCHSRALHALKDSGFSCMKDVLDRDGNFITWDVAQQRGAPVTCENAFRLILQNLKPIPELAPQGMLHDIFLEDQDGIGEKLVWQFKVPASRLSERWIPFMDKSDPEGMFRVSGKTLVPIRN